MSRVVSRVVALLMFVVTAMLAYTRFSTTTKPLNVKNSKLDRGTISELDVPSPLEVGSRMPRIADPMELHQHVGKSSSTSPATKNLSTNNRSAYMELFRNGVIDTMPFNAWDSEKKTWRHVVCSA